MLSVVLTFFVDDMKEVNEAVLPIAAQLQTLTIPPVGHQYVKNMANEKGSTVNLRVEIVPEEDALSLQQYQKTRKKKELIRS